MLRQIFVIIEQFISNWTTFLFLKTTGEPFQVRAISNKPLPDWQPSVHSGRGYSNGLGPNASLSSRARAFQDSPYGCFVFTIEFVSEPVGWVERSDAHRLRIVRGRFFTRRSRSPATALRTGLDWIQ